MASEHLTTCGLCPAFCGMKVELEGSTVVAARGDPEHPISRGYLCPLHLTHGWLGRNVCRLVSSEIYPETGQPVMMSAIPVELALSS